MNSLTNKQAEFLLWVIIRIIKHLDRKGTIFMDEYLTKQKYRMVRLCGRHDISPERRRKEIVSFVDSVLYSEDDDVF